MPTRRTQPSGYARARQLRNTPTPAEQKLWACLRDNKLNGTGFRRQYAIGNYVVDFCSVKKKLIIELDGGGHLKQEEYDTERTHFLEAHGYRVIRFWNNQVLEDLDAVVRAIQFALSSKPWRSTRPPPRRRGRGRQRGRCVGGGRGGGGGSDGVKYPHAHPPHPTFRLCPRSPTAEHSHPSRTKVVGLFT